MAKTFISFVTDIVANIATGFRLPTSDVNFFGLFGNPHGSNKTSSRTLKYRTVNNKNYCIQTQTIYVIKLHTGTCQNI